MATFRSGLKIEPSMKDLREVLQEMDAALPKQLNKVLKPGAEVVASDARSKASGLSPMAAASASQIKSSGTAQGALVSLAASKGKPYALAALLGMTRRTGWFAAKKYGPAQPGSPQHVGWSGTGWQVGGPGGPRAINPAFASKQEEFVRLLVAELDAFGAKHFPDPD